MGGEGPAAATWGLPLPEDLSREGRQLSEEERSSQPAACARSGERKLGRTFRGRESQSGRKCEQPGEEGRRGRASGRGRSRRRRPRLPHPRPGSAARGAGRRRERGARGRGRGGMRRGARARPGARRGGGSGCAWSRRSPAGGAPALGTSQRWNPRNAGLQELLLQASRSRALLMWTLGKLFSKVKAEDGGRDETPYRVRGVGGEKDRRPQPTQPSAAPAGAEGRKKGKSHLDLRKPQWRGSGRNSPAPI